MWPIVRDAFADATPAVRSQVRWILAFWCVMVALQAWDSADASGPAGVAEFLSAILGVSGAALLGVAYGLQRAIDEKAGQPSNDAPALQQVLIALPALGFAAGVALGGATTAMIVRTMLGVELPVPIVGSVAYVVLLFLAAGTVTRSSRTLFRHAAANAAAAAEARARATAAQLSALQARMNPHFLFNALNTVAALVRSDPPKAERAVEDLSDVLRHTLDRSSASGGTVSDEIEYLRRYLALEQARWGDRLHVRWNVEARALDSMLPPLLLQPLVENALHHGLGGRLEGGTIEITAHAEEGRLTVGVRDDGNGFQPGWVERLGLSNVRARLNTLYGPQASLTVTDGQPGARVTITLPAAPAAGA